MGKMKSVFVATAAATLAFSGLFTTSQAATITVTVSGVVGGSSSSSGDVIDTGGVFSTGGHTDLTGMDFTSTITFTDTKGVNQYQGYYPSTVSGTELYGNGANSPLTAAQITINNVTFDIPIFNNNNGSITSSKDFISGGFDTSNPSNLTQYYILILEATSGNLFNIDYHNDGSYALGPQGNVKGVFNGPINAYLDAQTISVSSTGAPTPFTYPPLPEPGTWVLQIVGVALMGAALRRRPAQVLA